MSFKPEDMILAADYPKKTIAENKKLCGTMLFLIFTDIIRR